MSYKVCGECEMYSRGYDDGEKAERARLVAVVGSMLARLPQASINRSATGQAKWEALRDLLEAMADGGEGNRQ